MAKATCACRGSCLAARPSPGGYEPSDTRHLAPTGDGGHTRLACGVASHQARPDCTLSMDSIGATRVHITLRYDQRRHHHPGAVTHVSRVLEPADQLVVHCIPTVILPVCLIQLRRRRFGCLVKALEGAMRDGANPAWIRHVAAALTTVQAFGEHDNSFGPWTSESTARCRGAGFSASPPDCLRQAAFKQLTISDL